MRYASPLRYPGGKASLTKFLTDIIDLNDLRGCEYFEPYAGGAGAALSLLENNVVSFIYLNDADPRIYAFWSSVLYNTEEFIERINSVPLTINEWHRQNKICSSPSEHSLIDLGFSAFFMNRCNRSGMLSNAGPIGGFKQDGNWKIDVRFNRVALIERILFVKKLHNKIRLSQKDALKFLKTTLPQGKKRGTVFVYLDPPYVNNSERLYFNSYDINDHKSIAKYLNSQRSLRWILSYDDNELIRQLYYSQKVFILPIKYALQQKRNAYELIISPNNISIPSAIRKGHNEKIASKAL
jgi:DNA adenine methylase